MKFRYLYSSLLALSFVMSTLAMENENENEGQKTSSLEIVEKFMLIQKKFKTVILSDLSNKNDSEHKVKGNPTENTNNLKSLVKLLSNLNLTKVKKDIEALQDIKKQLRASKIKAVVIMHNDTLKSLGFSPVSELSSDEKEDNDSTIETSLKFEDNYNVWPVNKDKEKLLAGYIAMGFGDIIDDIDCAIV